MLNSEDSILPVVIKSECIFEESFIKIQKDELQVDSQSSYSYYSLLTHPFAVAVLATTTDGRFILNEEYRHPTGHLLLGCPGGYVEPGEDPLQAAKRELLEETGYQASSFHLMGNAYPYSGFSGQQTLYIRAKEAVFSSPPKTEPSEIIQTRLLTFQEVLSLIKRNTRIDGVLCTALFFLQNY